MDCTCACVLPHPVTPLLLAAHNLSYSPESGSLYQLQSGNQLFSVLGGTGSQRKQSLPLFRSHSCSLRVRHPSLRSIVGPQKIEQPACPRRTIRLPYRSREWLFQAVFCAFQPAEEGLGYGSRLSFGDIPSIRSPWSNSTAASHPLIQHIPIIMQFTLLADPAARRLHGMCCVTDRPRIGCRMRALGRRSWICLISLLDILPVMGI